MESFNNKSIYIDIRSSGEFVFCDYEIVLSKSRLVIANKWDDCVGGNTDEEMIDMGVEFDSDPIINYCFDKLFNSINDEEAKVNAGGYETGFGKTAKIYVGEENECVLLLNKLIKRERIDMPVIGLDYIEKYVCYIISTLKFEKKTSYIDNLLKKEKLAEDVKDEYEYFKINGYKENLVQFEYCVFGNYPQMLVEDKEICNKLLAEVGEVSESNTNWIDSSFRLLTIKRPYFFFTDVAFLNKKYRGVYFEYCSPNKQNDSKENCDIQIGNGFKCNTYYWFEYSPIIWKAFKEEDHYLLISDFILDAASYKNALNQNSDKMMFNKTELENIICPSEIKDFPSNLFIPSVRDVKTYLVKKELKKPIPTQYALIKGYPLSKVKWANVSPFYWLSTPLEEGYNRNCSITEDGTLINYYCENYGYLDYMMGGVRPAVKVKNINKINKPVDYISEVIEKTKKKEESAESEDSYQSDDFLSADLPF